MGPREGQAGLLGVKREWCDAELITHVGVGMRGSNVGAVAGVVAVCLRRSKSLLDFLAPRPGSTSWLHVFVRWTRSRWP